MPPPRARESSAALPLPEDEELSLPTDRTGRAVGGTPSRAESRMPSSVPIQEVMTSTVVAIEPTETLFDAVTRMIRLGVSGLPVAHAGRVVGVLSQSDVGRYLAERTRLTPLGTVLEIATAHEARDPGSVLDRHASELQKVPASVAMTPDPVTISPDATVGEAARLMEVERVKRLPVVAPDGRLVGIVTRRDLLRSFQELKRQGPRRTAGAPA